MANGKITRRKYNSMIKSWDETKQEIGESLNELTTGASYMVMGLAILYVIIQYIAPILKFIVELSYQALFNRG